MAISGPTPRQTPSYTTQMGHDVYVKGFGSGPSNPISPSASVYASMIAGFTAILNKLRGSLHQSAEEMEVIKQMSLTLNSLKKKMDAVTKPGAPMTNLGKEIIADCDKLNKQIGGIQSANPDMKKEMLGWVSAIKTMFDSPLASELKAMSADFYKMGGFWLKLHGTGKYDVKKWLKQIQDCQTDVMTLGKMVKALAATVGKKAPIYIELSKVYSGMKTDTNKMLGVHVYYKKAWGIAGHYDASLGDSLKGGHDGPLQHWLWAASIAFNHHSEPKYMSDCHVRDFGSFWNNGNNDCFRAAGIAEGGAEWTGGAQTIIKMLRAMNGDTDADFKLRTNFGGLWNNFTEANADTDKMASAVQSTQGQYITHTNATMTEYKAIMGLYAKMAQAPLQAIAQSIRRTMGSLRRG